MTSNQIIWLRKLLALTLGLSVVYLSYLGILFDFSILIIIGVVIVAILPGRNVKHFLIDWTLMVLLLSFHTLARGHADDVGFPILTGEIIAAERLFFGGHIPSVVFQNLWHIPGSIQWYDTALALFYVSFFIFPFILAYLLWLRSRKDYYMFMIALTLINVISLIFFIFFPSSPPWLAAEQGHFTIHRLTGDAIDSFYINEQHNFLLISKLFLVSSIGNHVAALPSLHTAWPFLASILTVHFYGRKYLPLFIVPLGIMISIVYFGEHYVVDVLAGAVLAWAGYRIALYLRRRLERPLKPAVVVSDYSSEVKKVNV